MFRIDDTDAQIRKLGLWFVIMSLLSPPYFYSYYYWIFFISKYRLDKYLFGLVQ